MPPVAVVPALPRRGGGGPGLHARDRLETVVGRLRADLQL